MEGILGVTGKLIVIDGIDSCGKSTQVDLLCSALDKESIPYIVSHEPQKDGCVGKLIYELLNSYPLNPYSMALLYTADRADHVIRTIEPALDDGLIVILDRYHCSTVAYQGVHCDPHDLWELATMFPEPDVVFIIDGVPEVFAERNKDSNDIFEKDLTFQSVVRKQYLRIAALREKYFLLNGHSSPDVIHDHIMSRLEKEGII